MDSPIWAKVPKLMENSGESSSSSGSVAPNPDMSLGSNDDQVFVKVFTNDIIWRTLGSYLNLDDLKDCRRTCQLFNTKVLSETNFKDLALLNIPLSKFRASDFGKTRVLWRHLALNVDRDLNDKNPETWWDPTEDPLELLGPLLGSVTSLKLHRSAEFRSPQFPKVRQTFSTILPMMPQIQKISIDVRIFQEIDPSWFAYASVTLMSKVKEFHLECNPPTFVPEEVMRCSMSLPFPSVHLQVLHIDSFVWKWDVNRAHDSAIDRLDRLFRILRQNQGHLRSLQVQDPELWTNISAYRFGTLPKFPQLKVIKLLMMKKKISEAHFIEFLNTQPECLEEIDLEFVGSIPSAVFQVVKDRAMNLNLKILRIITTKFKPSYMKKWSFLKETNLEEFAFQLKERSVRLSNEQLKDFFGALPKNAKKLSIWGVKPTGGQQIFNLNVSKCFDPEVLTHLKLRRCKGLLKNSVLQEFWKTLKNLRLLDLSNCGNNCTDWGFTGVPAGFAPQGVAISMLKGLKSLTLQSCVGLTNRTLLDGIKFPELQFLDLMGNFQFTESGYVAVIRQNPSLQTFASEQEDGEKWRSPYIVERRRRSVKINPRLTREFGQEYTWDYSVSDWEDEESDDGESGEEDPWQGIRYWRDPPLGGAADGSEIEEDEEELPDLDEEGDWLAALFQNRNRENGNRNNNDAGRPNAGAEPVNNAVAMAEVIAVEVNAVEVAKNNVVDLVEIDQQDGAPAVDKVEEQKDEEPSTSKAEPMASKAADI